MIAEKQKTPMRVEFETVACPLCESRNYNTIYSFSDRYGSYALVHCSHCGFQFLNPRPAPLGIGIYYDAENYTPFLSSGNSVSMFNRLYTFVRSYSVAWKRHKIGRFGKKGSILDIGCGTGEFLHEMSSNGWKTAGLEPSKEASGFARKTYGLNITTGFIDEPSMRSITGPFDVITMWHVLEHVHTPIESLGAVKEKLSDDGLLVIAVPNMSSFDAGVYRRDWVALDVPRHLLHFTPATMKELLSKAGLDLIDRHQMPLDTVFNCIMSEKNVISRNARYKIPFFLIRLTLTIIVSWIIGLDPDKGSSVMYYARKKG